MKIGRKQRLMAWIRADKQRACNLLTQALLMVLAVLLYFFWKPKNGSFPLELTEIETLSETKPAEALSALAQYDTTRCMPGAVSYYQYISLKAHCRLQPDYKVSPSRLTKTIVDFEYVEPKPQRLADLYYYSGCVFRNMEDGPQAQAYFLKSLPLYQRLKDKPKLARCHDQIGQILLMQGFYGEAAKRFAASAAYFHEANDTLGRCLSLRHQANCYRVLDRVGLADSVYRQALSVVRHTHDRHLEAYLWGQYAALLVDKRQYREAEELVRAALKCDAPRESGSCQLLLAKICAATGRDAQAASSCRELMRTGTIAEKQEASRILSRLYQRAGRLAEALRYADMSVEMSDSLKNQEAMLAVSRMNASYNYNNYVQEEQRLRKEKLRQEMIIEAISVSFVLVVFFLLWQLRRMSKKRQEQMRKYAHVVVSLQETEEDRKVLARQLEEREAQLQAMTLQGETRDERLGRVRHSDIYRKLKAACGEDFPRLETSDWQALENLLYREFPNFQSVLLSIPNLSEQNRNMCLLIKMRFKPIEIARLLCRDKSTINSARRRLYERVFNEKGTPSLWDEFILSV